MTTSSLRYPITGWAALATGIASILATVLIILFYIVGGLYGTLNDIFNGVAGILSGILVWMLFSEFRLNSSILHRVVLVFALIGAVIVVFGSILIIFDFTGWVLAGWYTTLGNALIGIWLLVFSYSARRSNILPYNLSTFGLVVGAIMATGIIVIPGILTGIDSVESTPGFLNLGYLGFLGTYFLYPIWAFWLGRILLSR
jgi:hypothetical protein